MNVTAGAYANFLSDKGVEEAYGDRLTGSERSRIATNRPTCSA